MVGVTVSTLVRTGPTSVPCAVMLPLSIDVEESAGGGAVSVPTVAELVRETVTVASPDEPQTTRQDPMGEESLK